VRVFAEGVGRCGDAPQCPEGGRAREIPRQHDERKPPPLPVRSLGSTLGRCGGMGAYIRGGGSLPHEARTHPLLPVQPHVLQKRGLQLLWVQLAKQVIQRLAQRKGVVGREEKVCLPTRRR
jgi:hypothetical protein